LTKVGLCLVVLHLVNHFAEAKDIVVGGEAGWAQTAKFDDIDANVGDRLVSRGAVRGLLHDTVLLFLRSFTPPSLFGCRCLAGKVINVTW